MGRTRIERKIDRLLAEILLIRERLKRIERANATYTRMRDLAMQIRRMTERK